MFRGGSEREAMVERGLGARIVMWFRVGPGGLTRWHREIVTVPFSPCDRGEQTQRCGWGLLQTEKPRVWSDEVVPE